MTIRERQRHLKRHGFYHGRIDGDKGPKTVAATITTAREGYVLQVELAAAQAELAELRRRAAVADEANRVLQEKVQASEREALRFAAELEAFEHETDINPDGVVDGDLLRRLRSN